MTDYYRVRVDFGESGRPQASDLHVMHTALRHTFGDEVSSLTPRDANYAVFSLPTATEVQKTKFQDTVQELAGSEAKLEVVT